MSADWQPIETAPKDGTRILICNARCPEDEIEITEWFVIPREHYEHVEGDLYRKVSDDPYEAWNGNGHRATHWMPLPAPPTDTPS